MESSYLIEVLRRGDAAGIMLVTAVLFARARRAFGVEWLGALFLFATVVHAVTSSPGYSALLGPVRCVFMGCCQANAKPSPASPACISCGDKHA